jgi:Glycosyltransferase like family
MIAFACSIIAPDVYERCARPGIERASELDSRTLAHAAAGSVARSYNLLLDTASQLDDLEAVVLLHEDAEILQADFCARLRQALADPSVMLVGCVGARGVRDMAWWDGELRWNSAPYRHPDPAGVGDLAFAGKPGSVTDTPGEVDSLYGVLLALSPWAARNLRFEESIGMLHGYDYDLCRQARAQGGRVVAADLRIAHHHPLDLVKDIEIWVGAHMRAAELWDPSGGLTDDEWRQRARRAEASAAAARLLAASKLLHADATNRQHEVELQSIRGSVSWRVTEPLRRGNALLRRLRNQPTNRL